MNYALVDRVRSGKLSLKDALSKLGEEIKKAQESGDKKRQKQLSVQVDLLLQLEVPDATVDPELDGFYAAGIEEWRK